MSVISDICKKNSNLTDVQIQVLENIGAILELASDIAHAQLTLYIRVHNSQKLMVISQAKPATSYILYKPNLIGSMVTANEESLVWRTILSGQPIHGQREWVLGMFLKMVTYPIMDENSNIIAAISFEASNEKTPDDEQKLFIETANMLIHSIKKVPSGKIYRRLSPRDGIVIVDSNLRIIHANPAANSIYNILGCGTIIGRRITDRQLNMRLVHKVFITTKAIEAEVEAGDMILLHRAIPVILNNKIVQVIFFVTDITEIKKKEKELLIKSAVIQEIHHRVKNNLQTIASLLRLQARRTKSLEVKAALRESVNRILSISVVHEFLSQQDEEVIDVAEVSRNITNVIINNMLDPSIKLTTYFSESTIILPSAQATSIALVINELVQNAIEHAFIGRHTGIIGIDIYSEKDYHHINIFDDGVGLPDDFSIDMSNSLGLQIIRTLIETDLGGVFELKSHKGTQAYIKIPREFNGG